MTLADDERSLLADPDACLIRPRYVYEDGLTLIRHRELWLRAGLVLDKPYLLRRDDAPCALDADFGRPWCANPHHFETSASTRPRRARAPRPRTGQPDAAAINRAKTHCPKNHPLTPENVYTSTDSKGRQHRTCRRCKIIRNQRRSQR